MNRLRWLFAAGAMGLVAGGTYLVAPNRAGSTRAADLVTRKGCEVTITSPALEPGGRLTRAAGDSLALTFSGRALRCPSTQVRVYASVAGAAVDAGEALLGTATSSAAGDWSYGPTTIEDVKTTVLRMEMTSPAGKVASTSVTIVADTTAPRVVVSAPAPDDWGRVRIVAPAADAGCGSGGNVHADLGEPGWVYDQDCAAGGQVRPVVTVTGGAPGTLTAWYADAGLASVPITASPQTFTSAELGTWTLPDWTREDLVVRADRQPDGGPAGGSATRVLMARVATSTPPALALTSTVIHPRGAHVDVSYVLPSVPPEVGSAHISLAWTTSTSRSMGMSNVSRGLATVTSSPTALADPPTAGRGAVQVTSIADGGTPIWCSASPDVAPDAGTLILPSGTGVGSPMTHYSYNDCNGWPTPAPMYCVTAGGTQNVVVTEVGRCAELTRAWLDGPSATRREQCWMNDATEEPQVWTCADGQTYAPGVTYTAHLRGLPPLNTYFFAAQVTW